MLWEITAKSESSVTVQCTAEEKKSELGDSTIVVFCDPGADDIVERVEAAVRPEQARARQRFAEAHAVGKAALVGMGGAL